jgi:ABC-type transport system involved in cytochrome bd biosynthesis fused ATPase/permease subunit
MDKLFDEILQPTILTVIGFFITWLCQRSVAFLNQKLKMNITQNQERQIDDLLKKAIYSVEEKAAAAAKHGLEKIPAIEKHQMAINFVMRFIPKANPDKISDLLKAKLGDPEIQAGATSTNRGCDCKN